MPFGKIIKALSVLAVLPAILSSCGLNSEPTDKVQPQFVILFSPGGLGDMSYNDCILEGIQRFKLENDDIDIYIYSPESIDEAERIFSDWLVRPGNGTRALFVLASSDYEPMAEKYLSGKRLSDGKSILLFESRRQYEDENIHTFHISTFGSSYLAGKTAALCTGGKKALVVLANPFDGPIGVARDGFCAGFGRQYDVEYLADDWTGYIQANLAYKKMGDWAKDYDFVFPVAGGSNSGIYRYSREYGFCPFLAGMDIDQSALSSKITGSVIKHIDRLIYEYMTAWTFTGKMPEAILYGLESGYADWLLSPLYEREYGLAVREMRQQAISEEKKYYEAVGN